MNTTDLNDKNFDDFISAPGMAVVVFTATWCQPCQDLKRILESVCADRPDWQVAMVDIEASPSLAEDFQVKSVPWVLLVRDGVVLFAESGTLSAPSLVDLMQQTEALDMSTVKDNEG